MRSGSNVIQRDPVMGTLGISSYGFCVRDYNGDLVYAESANIGVITCMVAEATTIWKALNFCK